MTTSVDEEELWKGYDEAYRAELAAYYEWGDVRNKARSDSRKVRLAHAKWASLLTQRYDHEDRIAAVLGIRRYAVRQAWRDRQTRTMQKVKRDKSS